MIINSNLFLNKKYSQWLSSLPAAKNMVHQSAASGALKNTPASRQDTINTSVNKVLYSGEVVKSDIKNFTGTPLTEFEFVPSSLREYTVNDALNYRYNKAFSIKLDDLMNGHADTIKLRPPGSTIPNEFIENLKQNGIHETSFDAGWINFYLNGLNEDSAKYSHSVDYLASGYAAAKQNINDNFIAEEKITALERLDKDFTNAVTIFAQKVSKELGGFFAESGSPEETQKIYDSVVSAYNKAVGKYSNYIKNNNDYAGLNNTENEWLKRDNSYMASSLRKAVSSNEAIQAADSNSRHYSLAELEKTQVMVNEIKNHTANIKHYESEEKIGLDFAMLHLKGAAFSKYSGVSDSLKNAISKSIDDYISTAAEKLNERLQQDRKGIAEPGRMANLKKKDIFSVYNKVIHSYKMTGSILKALQEGAAFGYKQHMEKVKNPQYSVLNRYGNNASGFWRNFYGYTPSAIPEDSKPATLAETPNLRSSPLNSYKAKKTGIQFIAKEWNNFVSKLTDDKHAGIAVNTFSAYS